MSKTLELPEGTYRVTKTKVKDDSQFRMIDKGHTVIGEYSPTVTVGQSFHAEGRGFRDYVRTSWVKDFILMGDGKVEIETENSIYLLEEIDPKAPPKLPLT